MSRQSKAKCVFLSVGLILTGCAEVPLLDATITPELEKADYPELVPIGTLLTALPGSTAQSEDLQDELQARRDRLQERADRLRESPVVDTETEARMKAGVQG